MIDHENEVFTRVATVLRSEFAGINVSSEYVNAPSSFPYVSIEQKDSFEDKKTGKTNLMFEVNVYSNNQTSKKTDCKKIISSVDRVFYSMNFRRTSLNPVPNMENATIYRLAARYIGQADETRFYRR